MKNLAKILPNTGEIKDFVHYILYGITEHTFEKLGKMSKMLTKLP